MSSLTPWRAEIARWPDEWRERWGHRANQLEDAGLDWISAERQAWNEILELRKQPETVPLKKPESTRTLFKESA